MDLFPQDLRARQHQRTVQRRAGAGSTTPVTPTDIPPKLGRLGRFWASGSRMTDTQAAISNPAAAGATQVIGWLSAGLGTLFSALAAGIAAKKGLPPEIATTAFLSTSIALTGLGFGPWARAGFRSLHSPLRESEIETLLSEFPDPLDQTYLKLVRDATRQTMSEEAAADVRASLVALADALDRLPEVAPSDVDPAALIAEATALEGQSVAEADRLISDSLHRQADALRRRAASAERSALTGRRVGVLRAELRAQMEALHEGLAAMSSDTTEASAVELGHMAGAVRQVASEVVAAADARAELAAYAPGDEPEQNTQRLGR